MDIKRILRAIGIFSALILLSLLIGFLKTFIPVDFLFGIFITILIFYWCYMVAGE